MNILYLSEDYIASKVHHELVSRLSRFGHNITVFSVLRLVDIDSDIRYTYQAIDYKVCTFPLHQYLEIPYKLFFSFKMRLKFTNLMKQIDPLKIDFIHAATLFSEGSLAYELFKRYNIPYSVAVRGTDIELYLSKMPHLWKVGREILKNAYRIIFVSPIIQEKFKKKKSIAKLYPLIADKCTVISNGIEDYWIQNQRNSDNGSMPHPRDVLYIGRFDENKNVESLIKAVLALRESIPDIKLNLVGGGDSCHKAILAYCEKYPNNISYLGKIYDKDKLLKVMRDNQIFAMVSHLETFGLVYLEALSQGLPILYSEGQGIDKSVPDDVGEKAISTSQDDITNKLRKLIINFRSYRQLGDKLLDFSWDKVAEKYSNIFNHSL